MNINVTMADLNSKKELGRLHSGSQKDCFQCEPQ